MFVRFLLISSVFLLSPIVAMAQVNVTSISTQDTAGTPTSNFVLNASSNGYTVANFDGVQRGITSAVAGGINWAPNVVGQVLIRRNNATETFSSSNPNQVVAWYNKQSGSSGNPVNVGGSYVNTMENLFQGSNILRGTDNLFSNTGNGAGNNNNIERVDFLFPGGFVASSNVGLIVMERGTTNAHDGFRVAAITALSGTNVTGIADNPLTLATGTYGNTDIVPTATYSVLRFNVAGGPDTRNQSAEVTQPIGAVIIRATDIPGVIPGQTYFGFTLFATDVSTNLGSNLLDFTNPTFFPTNTTEPNGGGIDLVASGAILVISAVPEPATYTLLLTCVVLVCLHQRKKLLPWTFS